MALRNHEIGARLRELRGSKPQTTVADDLGVAERTYQNWEAGDAKPSYRNLQRLAEYHGVGEDFILTGEGTPPELEPETADPFPAPTPMTVLERLLEAVEKQNGLLERQSRVLERIEGRLGADEAVRDELADLIRQRGREIVEGLPPASAPGQRPELQRSPAAPKKRAAKPRTPAPRA